MTVGGLHVVVSTLGVVVVIGGVVWILGSTIWLHQPERRRKGEKGRQSNREYSYKVLASKDLHYICNIIKGNGMYLWTKLQNAKKKGKA